MVNSQGEFAFVLDGFTMEIKTKAKNICNYLYEAGSPYNKGKVHRQYLYKGIYILIFVAGIFPTRDFKDVTRIDLSLFMGKELILFDIDNTLFYPESTKIRKDILAWVQKVKKKHRCVCVSNSFSIQKRKDAIEKILGISVFVSPYKKPSRKLFTALQKTYPYPGEKMVIVGDMRFTDILFGNKNKMMTLLVSPLAPEVLFTLKVSRIVENVLVWMLRLF